MIAKTDVREYKHADSERAGWAPGPWDNEPDKIQWVDAATNLDCLMHRNRLGAWCGYVGIAEGHPAFGKWYDNVDVDVHGGLTYADFCQEGGYETIGICHVPGEGRPHKVWWLGFDCGHAGDRMPGMEATMREIRANMELANPGLPDRLADYRSHDAYRDRDYVEHEVAQLAQQLAAQAHHDSSPAGLVHALLAGQPLCGFTSETPDKWPAGNSWVAFSGFAPGVTCGKCKRAIIDRAYGLKGDD